MPHAWGASARVPAKGAAHPAWADPLLNASIKAELSGSGDYLAFDVHPARKIYAYCSGNAILTYDYEGFQRDAFLDFAYLPEPCSDIRFTSGGNYLMATSRVSSRLFRCDPQCSSEGSLFVYSATLKRRACSPAWPTTRQWGEGLRVYCIPWFNGTFTASEAKLMQLSKPFVGGVHNFVTGGAESLLYASGSFHSVAEPSSWVWWIYADASPNRATIHTFLAGEQIVGPLAYNDRSRRIYVPVHDHTDKTKRWVVYQITISTSGQRTAISVLHTQLFSDSAVSAALKSSAALPAIPGFAVRVDTGVLSMVDEQEGRVHVFACAGYDQAPCSSNPPLATPYGAARYKDLEFVGKVIYTSSAVSPLTAPSKLFLTSLEDAANSRAELYVQCAKCQVRLCRACTLAAAHISR